MDKGAQDLANVLPFAATEGQYAEQDVRDEKERCEGADDEPFGHGELHLSKRRCSSRLRSIHLGPPVPYVTRLRSTRLITKKT